MTKRILCLLLLAGHSIIAAAESGYELWLRYRVIDNDAVRQQYLRQFSAVFIPGTDATSGIIRTELQTALPSMFGKQIKFSNRAAANTLVIATPTTLPALRQLLPDSLLQPKYAGGFCIKTTALYGKNTTIITAASETGLLYGTFHLLRLLQQHLPVQQLHIVSVPRLQLRLLNHWDNLDRHVERGYAGCSIWNWHTLPHILEQRYTDYARANASIGINGTVLTNVNANATVLTHPYLLKVKALADLFRPYGIKVYLTARFSAPIEIGKLRTADPLDPQVQQWWKEKAAEIYSLIPDFGGFLVKANSEGQPGPQDYKRTHADGANMLADAVAPYNGIVMWRAFVYDPNSDDRFKQAYEEFHPLDGRFRENVMVQVKNGPIDFQPREPFSPLFGAMPQTPLLMEFQITQEYTGQGTNLCYLAPLFKEVLEADTYVKGKGSTVARIIDGTLHHYPRTGMAGVSNIGSDINWTGHPLAQANWYAFGRLAWDHELSAAAIANEWVRQTFSNNATVVNTISNMLLQSHEAVVNYMTPIGLTHIMYNGHHYGPMPWGNTLSRPDWNPVYYHRADTAGIGFNRTATGSNALAQYAPAVQQVFGNVQHCPDAYLLWFHRVPWTHTMQSGRTLWEEMCHKYNEGVDTIRSFIQQWQRLEGLVDAERYRHVQQLLQLQLHDAIWWRDACLLYFQTFSRQPIPSRYEQPRHNLDYYKNIRIVYAPGN
jgi:alpha-glucuronidase